jgi:hypothetical protein
LSSNFNSSPTCKPNSHQLFLKYPQPHNATFFYPSITLSSPNQLFQAHHKMKSSYLTSSALLLLSSPSIALPLGQSLTNTSSLSLTEPSEHQSHRSWEAAGNVTKHIGSHISQYIAWPFTKLSSTVTHITVEKAWSYQTTHEGSEWAIVPLYPSEDKIPSVHHMMRHPMLEPYGSEHSKELKREEEDNVLEEKMGEEHVLEPRMERPEGGGVRPMTPTSSMSPETTTPAGIKESFAAENLAKSEGEVDGNIKRQSITEIDNFYFNGTGNWKNDIFAWLWFKSLGDWKEEVKTRGPEFGRG